MENKQRFDQAIYAVPETIRKTLAFLPEEIKGKTEEIRIRSGLPVILTVYGEPMFISKSGQTLNFISQELLIASKSDVEECFRLLCRNSVYAHMDEIKNGYIMMKNGHRAGICGTLTENGNMRDITSINIRIAREIYGAADQIVEKFSEGGLLIAGPPGSGKTTILRDLIRQLSDGKAGKYKRISVIDSRGEISGSTNGVPTNNLGKNTDVIVTKNKASGIEIAVRTMFPNIVAFDEIGTAAELQNVSDSFNAGVSIITTAHIGNYKDLLCRSVTKGLLESGAVSAVALLSGKLGDNIKLLSVKELLCELTN